MTKGAVRAVAIFGILLVTGVVSAFAIYIVADGVVNFVRDASREIAARIATPSPT